MHIAGAGTGCSGVALLERDPRRLQTPPPHVARRSGTGREGWGLLRWYQQFIRP